MELYENGFITTVGASQTGGRTQAEVEVGGKPELEIASDWFLRQSTGAPHVGIEANDDLGNFYDGMLHASIGAGGALNPYHWRYSHRFSPAVRATAKELRFSVTMGRSARWMHPATRRWQAAREAAGAPPDESHGPFVFVVRLTSRR